MNFAAELHHAWVHGESRPFGSARIESINPATSRFLGNFDDGGSEAVKAAVASARSAFLGTWGCLSGAARAEHLNAWAARIAAETDLLAWLEMVEVGRPIASARALVSQAPSLIGYYAGLIAKLEVAEGVGKRRARGTVGAITPWNFPVANVLIRAAPILAAGNTLVLKPSELAPRSAVLLAKLASEAGLPAGTFNVVTGDGAETGAALASHPDVAMVAFTGSTETGRAIVRSSADGSLKPVMLECGGKSPQIIFPDMVGHPEIWPGVFEAAFWNTGQWCAARTRLLIPHGAMRAAVEGLERAAAAWCVGDPADPSTKLGPLASRRQFERVQAYRNIARVDAELVQLPCPLGDTDPAGYYVTPELVLNPPQDSAVVQEEVFGPLLTIQEYGGLDEAVRLANDVPYGLTATVWAMDGAAGDRVAEELVVGSVNVITSPTARSGFTPGLTFEPRKQSGFGVDGGFAGLASFTAVQAVTHAG
jgi:acyl-CoA reductase-like NAD-dependent aldehyde dehydrogenase